MSDKQKTSYTKKKAGPQLGFRTSDFFKAKTFGGGRQQGSGIKFNPAKFRTQHKG